MKVRIIKDCDYVVGHLRYGHLETEVEVNSLEEAQEMFPDNRDSYWNMELVIDDYEVDDYEESNRPMTFEVIEE